MRKTPGPQTKPSPATAIDAAAIPIWKSRIGWRLALTVFFVTMLLQGMRLYNSSSRYEANQLAQLQALGRTAIVQHLSGDGSGTLVRADAERILATSPLRGITIYGLDGASRAIYGETASLRPSPGGQTAYRTIDGKRYEIVYPAQDLGAPINIVASLDAGAVQPTVMKYIGETLAIFALLSAVATIVVMLALGQWLLKPMLILRRNLLSATADPKNPDILGAGQEGSDEIGVTLRVANALIRKNAANVKQMERQTEEKIHRLAYYDALTGLPNRTLFIEKLEETIRRKVKAEDRRLCVLFLDIDNFSELNTTMGHDIGDRLLEAMGRRLSGAAPAEAFIARLGGDEFAVMIIPDLTDENGAAAVTRIIEALAEPVNILQEEFRVRVSAGVATAPTDGRDAATLMKNTETALKRAKEQGRDTVRFYSDDLDTAAQKRFRLLSRLREAMQNDELTLSYHPQFDLATSAIIGAEALLRWESPGPDGMQSVPTEEFVQIAEQTGLIIPIGEWVLRAACRAHKKWAEAGLGAMRVTVNISAVQFHHGDIVKTVSRILRETGVEARHLELDITESALMESTVASIDRLRQLHEMGVSLAIDDFGTGYSSLSTLRLCPINRIKIGPVFVRNALINAEDAAIVKTVITLGHNLGVKVMAEGVETADHAAFLKKEGCDEAQGFKYIQPLPADKFPEYISALQKDMERRAHLHVV